MNPAEILAMFTLAALILAWLRDPRPTMEEPPVNPTKRPLGIEVLFQKPPPTLVGYEKRGPLWFACMKHPRLGYLEGVGMCRGIALQNLAHLAAYAAFIESRHFENRLTLVAHPGGMKPCIK